MQIKKNGLTIILLPVLLLPIIFKVNMCKKSESASIYLAISSQG